MFSEHIADLTKIISHKLDSEATAKASWQTGHFIKESIEYIPYTLGRGTWAQLKFLGITEHGYLLVQDFYLESNKILTDPYLLLQENCPNTIIRQLKIEGKFVSWSEFGHKLSDGQYHNGKAEGYFIFWGENNRKHYEGFYHNAQKHGQWIHYWNSTGCKESQGIYENNHMHGIWEFFDQDGNKIKETLYLYGQELD